MSEWDREEEPLDRQAAPSSASAAPAAMPAIPITRRRLAVVVGGIVILWLVGVFAHQVSEAQAAQNQADLLRTRNAAMQRDIQSLERELSLIKQPAFVAEMARGYLLGVPGEIPFKVEGGSPLPADAPGSEGIVPTTTARPASPLDAWLEALFGSGH